MVNVLIVNDTEQGEAHWLSIATALTRAFHGTGCEFKVSEKTVSLRSVAPEGVASMVGALSPEPDIVLVDGRMPDAPTDGVLVIDALRRGGFRGYSYLWSAGDPAAEVRSQPGMFAPPGCGGYVSSDPEGLARDVRQSWDVLGKFEVSEPDKRVGRDPMNPALRLLTELQVGLFAIGSGTMSERSWWETCLHARDLFDGGPESFDATVAPFRSRGIDLYAADCALRKLRSMSLSDPEAIVKEIRLLRDCLLDAVAACR
jgi:hypothetical protein